MFEAFEQPVDHQALRRTTASVGAALAAYAIIGLTISYIAARAALAPPKPKVVEVTFRKPPPVVEAPPPPPPPPPPVARPKPPPTSAPAAAAPAPMVAPKELPLEKPPEADATASVAAIAVAVGGTGDGRSAQAADDPDEPAVAAATSGPINLPEDAEPPVPDESNALPEFPEAARTAGKEGVVVLKVVIQLDGTVGKIQVMKGEEPFVAAAIAAVKQWRYEPARVDDEPTAVFRIVKIPFQLKG